MNKLTFPHVQRRIASQDPTLLKPSGSTAMRTTRQMNVTMPNRMAAMVTEKVRADEYASESEVSSEGLRTLAARDRAVEDWLQNVVCPAYDALQADPENVRTIDQVRARIDARHATSQ